MAGLLSVVGTPIGNLQDASPRVIDVLGRADVVLCEDTRVTGKLLSAFGLRTRLERCDENVIASRVPAMLKRLEAGGARRVRLGRRHARGERPRPEDRGRGARRGA